MNVADRVDLRNSVRKADFDSLVLQSSMGVAYSSGTKRRSAHGSTFSKTHVVIASGSLLTTCARQLEQIPSLPAVTAIPFLHFILPGPSLLRPLDDDDQLWPQRRNPMPQQNSPGIRSNYSHFFLGTNIFSFRCSTFPVPVPTSAALTRASAHLRYLVSNISVFPSFFFCFCALALALPCHSMPRDRSPCFPPRPSRLVFALFLCILGQRLLLLWSFPLLWTTLSPSRHYPASQAILRWRSRSFYCVAQP
jgi:hypothetical protein